MAHKLWLLALCFSCLRPLTSALYTEQDAVVQLNADNFQKEVIDFKGVAVVEFFAPWCGHCKNLAPVYKQIAERLQGLALIGAVDCDDKKNAHLCAAYGIKGFPTVKVFPVDQQKNPYTGKLGKTPEDLQGMPSVKSVNDAVSNLYTDMFIKRLGDVKEYTSWSQEAKDVPKVVLFTSKTSTTVLYKSLSTQFRQRLAFAEVHESETELVEKLGVTDFPTLVVIKGDEHLKFSGKMSALALKEFLETHALPAVTSTEDEPSAGTSSQDRHQVVTPPVPITKLTVGDLADIDAKEPAWLVAFAAGTAEECAAQLKEFNKTVQDMQEVVKVGQLLLTPKQLQTEKSTLREHSVDTSALAEEPCKLQVVRFPFGEDKLESEEFATYQGPWEGKALQQFATDAIPKLVHEINDLEQFLTLPRPDGKPGFAPKVILATNKDEAPGVFRALAANLAASTNFVFGFVKTSHPKAQELLPKLSINKVPGMTVAGIMAGDTNSPEGALRLGFQPYVGALKYSHMHLFLNMVAQMVGAAADQGAPSAAELPVVAEVSTDSALQELCVDKVGLCVLGLLNGGDAVSDSVQVLQTVAQKRQGQPLQWGWVNARTQPSFAAALGATGQAFPTAVAISVRKQRYSVLVGSFDAENLNSWLDSVLVGRVPTVAIQEVPKLVDGGEAETPLEAGGSEEVLEPVEEMDLSEILGEEIEGAVGTKAELLEQMEKEIQAEEEAKLKSAKKSKKKKSKKSKKKKKKAESDVKDEL